jgi:AbrB family looped-hinge helix DNA binding protein
MSAVMNITSVTSKGQVTIPQSIRKQLGICQGSRIEFVLLGDHAELRVVNPARAIRSDGFGMLKTKRAAIPADFDVAELLKP